jgi:hypothetical protein
LPPQRTRFLVILAVIAVVGLAVRVLFLRHYVSQNLRFDDGLWYHGQANLLADGKGLLDPLAYVFQHRIRESAGHPPLWVFVLGAVSWLGGTSAHAHQLTQVAVATVAIVAVGFLGREVAGERAGLLAAALAALYPAFWANQGDVYAESLYTVVFALMLLVAYRMYRRPTWATAGMLGLTAGLAALTRGEALLFLPILVLPVCLRAPVEHTGRGVLIGAAAVGALVVLAPWTVYNATRFDDPVPVTTNLGPVVAGANCPQTYRGPELGSWNVGCSVRNFPGDESVVSARLRSVGTTYASDHLGRLPVVVAARIGRTFEVYDVDPNTLGPGWVQWLMAGAWYALVPLAVAGAVVLRRRRVTLLPVIATVVVVVIAVALTWGTPRFRVPVDVVALVLGAVALDAWIPGGADRRAPRAADGADEGAITEVSPAGV